VKSFASLIKKTRERFTGLTDTRRGKNTQYSMEDFATSAFSVFFTQSLQKHELSFLSLLVRVQ
jgi:hypothetical protein